MAATAYAAVVSLLNTLDQIKIHPFLSTYFNTNYTIDSLRKKVDFFVDFVEKYSGIADTTEAEDLVRQIGDVAHEAEDLIEVDAADRIRTASTSKNLIMTDKLKKITQEMDCVMEKAIKAKGENGFINPYSLLPPASSSAPPPTTTENCSCADDLVRRMGAVAVEAEDIFEFQAADQSRSGSTEKTRRKSRKRKQRLMDSNMEKAIKSKEKIGFLNWQPASFVPSSSSPSATSKTTTVVGFDGYLEQLLDRLTGHHSGRQILPIVGMGGIGKTTLARTVYQNLLTLDHFDVRAWVTVSQAFSATKIILQALSCLGGSTSDIYTSESDSQLGEELFKILYGRRYMIVLDDVWSVEAWEKIMFFFPENNNGSRIVVTTRESELVDYFGSSALAVDFLDEKNSWELFCEKTFAQEGCPPELEEIGKEIVQMCKGLPLAITVFGGLLRKLPKMREYWEIIAKDKSLILESGEGNIRPLSILYLSYKHLPVWLKSCFLYLGLFPEDHEIAVSQLIKLWVAEGFIRSMMGQSLEEVAESYTKELVDRNLLLVVGLTIDRKLKSCRVHDVVRELCIKIGEKEKYFYVRRDISRMRQYIVDESTARLFYPRESQEMVPSLFHPLILEGLAMPFKSRLLRVLTGGTTLLESCSQQVNLRFLFSDYGYAIHSSIQLLWSLQTLIIDCINGSFDAPCEIWMMPQLRHIEILESISLPDPLTPTCDDDIIVLQNLQTLKTVKNLILSKEVCKRIPNIKELEIDYDFDETWKASSCYHLHNLGCFNKLESLQLYFYFPGNSSHKLKLLMPSSVKKLSLRGCKLVCIDMEMIASLPRLQILILENNAVVGPKWDCVEREFLCLKHLQISSCFDLIKWSADSSSFPVLETLSLQNLPNLEEIPSGIGDIPTLERILLYNCNESVIMSAIKILKEQESLGNQSLQLGINFWDEDEAVTWRGKIQQLGITCQNLHI